MNVYDSSIIKALLCGAGHEYTHSIEDAEMILLNTCSIRKGAEIRVRGRLGQLKKFKDEGVLKYLGICGCMGQKEGTNFTDRVKFLDLVIGPGAVGSIVRLVDQLEKGHSPVVDTHGIDDAFDEVNPSPDCEITYPCFVSIMKGCDKRCTYCIVPYVRGPERSRHPDIILNEVQSLVDKGMREVTLIGQTVNSYNYGDVSFKKLLSMVNEIEGLSRIRFATSYPRDADYAMFDAVAELDKVCEHIHLPVQSGSDTVLRRMARGYTREKYIEKINYFRSLFSGSTIRPGITTDIIVGFPGETEEEFEETLAFVQEVRFDSSFMFKYSPRPDTPAAKFDGQLDEFTKARRLDQLINIQHDISMESNSSFIGKTVEAMVEWQGKKSENSQEFEARMRSGRPIRIYGNPGAYSPGDFLFITITNCSAYTLYGNPIEKDVMIHVA